MQFFIPLEMLPQDKKITTHEGFTIVKWEEGNEEMQKKGVLVERRLDVATPTKKYLQDFLHAIAGKMEKEKMLFKQSQWRDLLANQIQISLGEKTKVFSVTTEQKAHISPPSSKRRHPSSPEPEPQAVTLIAPAASSSFGLPLFKRPTFSRDYGFEVPAGEEDCETIPVYCTEAAQKARQTNLFIAWKGIDKLDKRVEKVFYNKFKTYNPSGITQARKYGSAGVKLFQSPDVLLGNVSKEQYSQFGCRLKFPGKQTGGNRPVIYFTQRAKVKLENGKEEVRYLGYVASECKSKRKP